MPAIDTEALGLSRTEPVTMKVEVSMPTIGWFGQRKLKFLPATIELPYGWNPGQQLIWTVRNTLCDYDDEESLTLHTNFAIAEIILFSKKDFRMVTRAGGIQPVQLELTNITPTPLPASKQIRIVATLAPAAPQAAPAPPTAEPETQEPPPGRERWFDDRASVDSFRTVMTESFESAMSSVLSDLPEPMQTAISSLLSANKLEVEAVVQTINEGMQAMQRRHQATIQGLISRFGLTMQTRDAAIQSITELVSQLSRLVQEQNQRIAQGQADTADLKKEIQRLQEQIQGLLNQED